MIDEADVGEEGDCSEVLEMVVLRDLRDLMLVDYVQV